MASEPEQAGVATWAAWTLLLVGIALMALGWVVPSRFNSIPGEVLREAGKQTRGLIEMAQNTLFDGNLGATQMLLQGADELGLEVPEAMRRRYELEREANPQLARWGAWDPFLEAGLEDVALSAYSDQPGIIGVVLAEECRRSMRALLQNSRNPLVTELLQTGSLTRYRKLFPVQSASGRPLEATLIVAALLAQGDHFSPDMRRELRDAIWQASNEGEIAPLEDFYLDLLSLGRLFDWGQLKPLVNRVDSLDTFSRLRYAFHRKEDSQGSLYAMCFMADEPEAVMSYLEDYGDVGFETLETAVRLGQGSLAMLLREQLPVERLGSLGAAEPGPSAPVSMLAAFSLRNPALSLFIKYALYFVGALLAFWGASQFSRFYREGETSPVLAGLQRLFGALVTLLVLIVLSEPHLARASSAEGYSFTFAMPVLAEVAGEIEIVETEPTITQMETPTLLSIAFFFLLQVVVFLICLLKVRDIDRRPVATLVKLRLMENEDNLFDTGLYVGIAGTCISLVMQVLGLIEANLLAAYSSNLFGILGVAIVKIRLVRPYKNKLIMTGQEELAAAASGELQKTGA